MRLAHSSRGTCSTAAALRNKDVVSKKVKEIKAQRQWLVEELGMKMHFSLFAVRYGRRMRW